MADFIQLLSVYYSCDIAAAQSLLPPAQMAFCQDIYLQVKLWFVPGVDIGTYADLAATERAEANRIGYAAFREWVDGNTAKVHELRTAASSTAHLLLN